jgi:acetyl esterase/lipase
MNNITLETNIRPESRASILKEALRQEARLLHQSHQPPATLADWLDFRESLKSNIKKSAGSFSSPMDLDVREHGTIEQDGYSIQKVTYQSRPGLRVTALLYRPQGPGPFPAILNMHGHHQEGKVAPPIAMRCQRLAKEGFVVLSPDAIGAGERSTEAGQFEYHGHHQGTSLLSVGETLLGVQLYDNMRGIDFLESLPEVDCKKIGATGGSGGGNQTLWVSAMDPRVKASVPVVSIGTFESYVTSYNCWCETLPFGLTFTETWGPLGLIAPNPLLILTAEREKNAAFTPKEMLRSFHSARKIYDLYGVSEKISYQTLDLPHGYFPAFQSHMHGWFKYWLKGEENSLPRIIPEVNEIPESELLCFPGASRPPEVRSLFAYSALRTQECKKSFPKEKSIDAEQKRQELKNLIRFPSRPDVFQSSTPVKSLEGGYQIEKFSVEPQANILIPCVLIYPEGTQPQKVTIAIHGGNKSMALNEPSVQKILQSGGAICLADLRHTGELKWDYEEFTDDLHVARAALWLGHTLIGQWVKDLFAIADTLKQRDTLEIHLLGFEEAAIAALAAAALEPHFSSVSVERMLSSYVVSTSPLTQRYSIYVPGLLAWGDIDLLAALSQCEVHIHSLVDANGQLLNQIAPYPIQKYNFT